MIWKFSTINSLTQEEYQAIAKNLSPTRKAHVDRMQMREDKLRSLLATHLASELLDIPVSLLERRENGQPYGKGCSQYVSIAHSGNGVVCAIGNGPIGVDIEPIGPIHVALIPRFCNHQEAQYILESQGQEQQKRFFEIWGAKEAYLKQQGTKTLDFKSINTRSLPVTYTQQGEFLITLLEQNE